MDRSSETLTNFIEQLNLYEDPSDNIESTSIISFLESHITKWIGNYSEKIGRPDFSGQAIVKVFGGHSFGVVAKGSDMDLVAIVPHFVSREEFFVDFPNVLQQMADVSNMRVIAAAYVPIIKFQYKETEIDLCLTVLTQGQPAHDLDFLSNDILVGMNELSVRSLSGVRENTALLSLVPDRDKFCLCLKVIKYWAKCRGLHHYSIGFLGGIAWAILVARIQQMFPTSPLSVQIQMLFKVYLEWQWMDPVLLRPLQDNKLKLPQWNPQVSTSDGRHAMAVITPAYPEHNAAFTATPSTIHVIQQELARGREIADTAIENGDWAGLFQPVNIGTLYKHYLVVYAKASNENDLTVWAGLVESRLRILCLSLEKQAAISLVHPYTKSQTFFQENEFPSTRWLLGLVLSAEPGAKLSLASDVKQFKDTVESLGIERHLFKQGMAIEVIHVKRKALPDHFNLT